MVAPYVFSYYTHENKKYEIALYTDIFKCKVLEHVQKIFVYMVSTYQ